MLVTKVHLQLPTHRACVTVNEDATICVFKYNNTVCDFDVFWDGDSLAASDYIVDPLPCVFYGVTFPEDPNYRPY